MINAFGMLVTVIQMYAELQQDVQLEMPDY